MVALPNSSRTNMPPVCVKHFLIHPSSIKNWKENVEKQLKAMTRWLGDNPKVSVLNYVFDDDKFLSFY